MTNGQKHETIVYFGKHQIHCGRDFDYLSKDPDDFLEELFLFFDGNAYLLNLSKRQIGILHSSTINTICSALKKCGIWAKILNEITEKTLRILTDPNFLNYLELSEQLDRHNILLCSLLRSPVDF